MIDPTAPDWPRQQAARIIRERIASGELGPQLPSQEQLAEQIRELFTEQPQPPAFPRPRHLHLVPEPLQRSQKQLPRGPAWRRLYVSHHVAATVLIAVTAVALTAVLTAWAA